MKPHRVVFLFLALGCAAVGALAPAAGCNGTGTTPMCDFPDGANNPESGCGELVEGAAPLVDVATSDVEPVDSPVGKQDGGDATVPPDEDSGSKDAASDREDAHDAHDAHITDAKADAKG